MLIKRGKTFHLRLMFQGRLYQKSLHTRNRKEAADLESVFRSSLVRGEFGIVDGGQCPTLAEFETRLFAHLRASVAPRTFGFYKEALAPLLRFETLANAKLYRIDPALIERFVQYRLSEKVTPVTVNHSLRTLRRALHLAQEWKLIKDVPKIKLLPGENQREHVINETELGLMVQYCKNGWSTGLMHHLLPFLVDTGLRISEACGLKREHVHLTAKPRPYIHIAKGKSKYAKRDIPLTERAAECLREALKQSRCDYVFTSKGGRKPLTRHYPSELFRLVRDAVNMDHGTVLHSTRHTFCTRLGQAGADAFTIQKLAGHSSITISQRYVHSDRSIKNAAIALLEKVEQKTAEEAPKQEGSEEEVTEI